MKNKEIYSQLEAFIADGVLEGSNLYFIVSCETCLEVGIVGYRRDGGYVTRSHDRIGVSRVEYDFFSNNGTLPCLHCRAGVTLYNGDNASANRLCTARRASTLLDVLERDETPMEQFPNRATIQLD